MAIIGKPIEQPTRYIDTRKEPVPEQYLSQIALLDATDNGTLYGIGKRIPHGGLSHKRAKFIRYYLRNAIIDIWQE